MSFKPPSYATPAKHPLLPPPHTGQTSRTGQTTTSNAVVIKLNVGHTPAERVWTHEVALQPSNGTSTEAIATGVAVEARAGWIAVVGWTNWVLNEDIHGVIPRCDVEGLEGWEGRDFFLIVLNSTAQDAEQERGARSKIWSVQSGQCGDDEFRAVAIQQQEGSSECHIVSVGVQYDFQDTSGTFNALVRRDPCNGDRPATDGRYMWHFGDPARSDAANGVAVFHADGSFVVVGVTHGAIAHDLRFNGLAAPGSTERNANTSTTDGFVVKFSATGDPLWYYQFGTDGTDRANGVAIDQTDGNVFVAGSRATGIGTEIEAIVHVSVCCGGVLMKLSDLAFVRPFLVLRIILSRHAIKTGGVPFWGAFGCPLVDALNPICARTTSSRSLMDGGTPSPPSLTAGFRRPGGTGSPVTQAAARALGSRSRGRRCLRAPPPGLEEPARLS